VVYRSHLRSRKGSGFGRSYDVTDRCGQWKRSLELCGGKASSRIAEEIASDRFPRKKCNGGLVGGGICVGKGGSEIRLKQLAR